MRQAIGTTGNRMRNQLGQGAVLRGHDFSRADTAYQNPLGFSLRGRVFARLCTSKNIPRRLKPTGFALQAGMAEALPYQSYFRWRYAMSMRLPWIAHIATHRCRPNYP